MFYAKILPSYKTQRMYDKTVDAYLPAVKFVPDWFATNKLLKKLDAIFSNDYIVLVTEDSVNVTFLVKI